ncbi:MAG TPA: O-antigen ligase family protein [Verrucomicrobiae bacterium]|nr:O-antigen ligase family protein [Verrucomicrobiae bacterium]
MNSTALKSLIVYGLCLPVAILLGILLGDPLSFSSLGFVSLLLFLLVFPFIIKWHYALVLLSWNMTLSGIYLLPGSPSVWLLLICLSFGMAIFERALIRESSFVTVPTIIWPLLFLAIVVLITAKLNGGFGFHSLGSDVYGGKKYVYLLAGIASYFVLTSRSIPLEKAPLYVGLFFLGGLTNAIGDLYPITPRPLQFIFWFFPPVSAIEAGDFGMTRLRGVGSAGFVFFCWMLIRYGIRGLFLSQKPGRLFVFFAVTVVSFLGGFRSTLLAMVLLFSIQFFLEGLHRTRLLPVLFFTAALGFFSIIPVASKLPFSFQRVLAIFPAEVLHIDRMARLSAEDSSRWRLDLWESLLPQVPRHLLLGKGYTISQEDFQMIGRNVSFKALDASQRGLALSYDYHNGPLSVIIPFGIWGAFGFCWFMAVAIWILIRNYRYGDPTLKIINSFLLAAFVQKTLMFCTVYGAFDSNIATFVGYVGLSVALNKGVRRKSAVSELAATERSLNSKFLPLRPSFQR